MSKPSTTRPATGSSSPTTSASGSFASPVSDVWSVGLGGDPTALGVFSSLLLGRDEPPASLVRIYKAAAKRYRIDWQVLAAINAIETDYGRDLATSSAGAIGWMQFMPATWTRYAVRADGTGPANPNDPSDAIFSAARMLAADGGQHDIRRAVFDYNHSDTYVAEVVDVAQAIVDRNAKPGASAHRKLAAMRTAATVLNGAPYIWGGGHGGWAESVGYDCSGFVSAVLHAAGYLVQPADTQTLPTASGIVAGVGKWVTIFDRTDGAGLTDDHVIIDINGQWWESGGTSSAGVHRIAHVSSAYLATFNVILHPRGL